MIFLKKKFRKKKLLLDNNLNLYIQEKFFDGYSTKNICRSCNIDLLRNKIYTHRNYIDCVISCEFNGEKFVVFDLDNEVNKDAFVEIFNKKPYVIFKSSSNKDDRYWGILGVCFDTLSKKMKRAWTTINDYNYVVFSRNKDHMFLRGTYNNKNRKPKLSFENKKENFSKNFKLFIDKLIEYYNNEGLELSALKYETPELVLKFERLNKIKLIEKNIK